MPYIHTTPHHQIYYEFTPGSKAPVFLYLHGFMSQHDTPKAKALKEIALSCGWGYLTLDYTGHGKSSGEITDIRIGRCLKDAQAVIENALSDQPFVVCGSSLGGWVSLLLALQYPERIKGVIGLAPGVDFTQRVWDNYLPKSVKERLKNGEVFGPSPETGNYCWTYGLFEEAKNHLLKPKGTLDITCPVLLIQGDADKSVPWQETVALKDQLASPDVTLVLVKNMEHTMKTEKEICILENATLSLLRKVEKSCVLTS